MSGGKASGKQPEDMILAAAEEALKENHHSHRDAVPLKGTPNGSKHLMRDIVRKKPSRLLPRRERRRVPLCVLRQLSNI